MSRSYRLSSFLLAILAVGSAACGPVEARDDAASSGAAANPSGTAADPRGTALAFGTQRIATGIRLRYAVQGDPAGPPVILLHGYSDSWYSFSPVLPLLPERYRVYALDLRGHGGSDQPRAGYHMADLAADVLAFMDAKRIPGAVIVGHSLGTFVAQYVARAAPDRVSGLVLIAGGPSVRQIDGLDEFTAAVHSLQDSVPLEFIRQFQASTVYQPLPDSFMARVVAESQVLAPHVWRGIMDGMLASGPVAPGGGHRIPTLLLRGDRDVVFPQSAHNALVALHPDAQAKVYPETGHAIHWERPAAVAEDLVEFLSEASTAREPDAPAGG
jgi:non-heme chloroperoxidase